MAVRSHILITVEPGKSDKVFDALKELPSVILVDKVTGTYDIALIIEVEDGDAIGDLVMDTLHGIPGLRTTNTLIAIRSYPSIRRQTGS